MSDAIVAQPYAPPREASPMAAGNRFKYAGTGGELFKELIVGALLTAITFGLYAPWFIVGLNKYVYLRTTLQTQSGDMKFSFTGEGGDLFVKGLVGYLLTIITFGIYGAWFIANLIRFNAESSHGESANGTKYRLGYTGTGGELFATVFVGTLLSFVTLGLYAPWFFCKLYKEVLAKVTVYENDQATGTLDFLGQGGEFFATLIVGYLLTLITFGIYGAWFNVSMLKFTHRHLRVRSNTSTWAGDFEGTGGQLFVIHLVGTLLTMVTFGIYFFWFLTNVLKFQLENTTFREVAA